MIRLIAAALLITTTAHARAPAPLTTATVTACFTPSGPPHCADEVAARIDQATVSVHVQAYSFTSKPIIAAIANAYKRGLDVQVVLDKSNETGTYSGMTFLRNAGVLVWIDYRPAIAHNKVIIVDGRVTIGGSLNYTLSADTRNAENVMVVDSPVVAGWYEQNFQARKAVSRVVK